MRNLKDKHAADQISRDLIEAIDRFHGNELKHRTESHIAEEVKVIKKYFLRFLANASSNEQVTYMVGSILAAEENPDNE